MMVSRHGDINSDLEQKLLSKIDENVLLCAVCRGRFNVPKILPCQHSFCEECLEVWVQRNSGRLTCPTCKQTSTLPLGGVPGIKNNRFINDLLDVINEVDKELQTSTQCEGCLREAKFWCNDCSQFFCDECVKSHIVVRSLKGHQLITMEVYKAKKESPDFRALRPRFCENHHDNKLEYFCETCKVSVCLKCTVVEHVTHSHKIEPIEKSCEVQIPIIEKNITHLKQKANEVRQTESETKAKIAEFELNQSHVRKQIKEKISKLRDELEKEEKRLLGQVDDICKSRGKQSDCNLEHLQNELASAESRCLYLEQLLIHGGPVDIMTVDTDLGTVATAMPVKCDLSDISTYIAFKEDSDCTILAGNVCSEQVLVNQGRNKSKRQMHQTAMTNNIQSSDEVKNSFSGYTTYQSIAATGYDYSRAPAFVERVTPLVVPVDIDLYMFTKHTQGKKLESIETDCDVKFHCDETDTDTGEVIIQPKSHRTIPEQTQFARDQFVSLYDNLYQTIEKFDMHIPNGLDKTMGEAAAEDTKVNFSNIYIKKEGTEHYAMYGEKESLQSARLHFLTCLSGALEEASQHSDETSREVNENQTKTRKQLSVGISTDSTSELKNLETKAVIGDKVEAGGGNIMRRREQSTESGSEERVQGKRQKHGVTMLSNNSSELAFLTDHGVKVRTYCADITKLAVDAITNAAHEQLSNTRGVAHAIRRAAGSYYHRECEEYIDNHGPLYVTEVIHTGAGILPCKYVLHALGPRWEDYKNKNECVETLKATVINCFNHANDLLKIQSLALPLMCQDDFDVPLDLVARAFFEAFIVFREEHPRGKGNSCLTEIHIVDLKKSSIATMLRVFRVNLRMTGCSDVVEPTPSRPRRLYEHRGRSRLRQLLTDHPATSPSLVSDDLGKAESDKTGKENPRKLFSSKRVRGSQKDKHRSIFSSERLTRPKEDRESRTKAQDTKRSLSSTERHRTFDKYSPLKSL